MPWFIAPLFSSKRILREMGSMDELPSDRMLLQETIRVAWPSILESFLTALVTVIDTIMVSSLGPAAIAAVGLTTQPKYICLSAFFSMNIAVSTIVARRRGEGDRAGANCVLMQALIMGVMLIAAVTTLGLTVAEPLMRLMGSNEATHELAVGYFRIIVGGMLFQAITMVINAAQRGAGNTKIAMRTNLVSNLVNIVFNYLLIGGKLGFPALGIWGAAIATVLGTVAASVMALHSVLDAHGYLCLRRKQSPVRFQCFNKPIVRSISRISASTLLEQFFMRIGFLLFTMIVARIGTNAFAAHQVGMDILNLSYAFGEGLSVAAVALVGRSLGAGRADLAKVYGGFCQGIGMLCSAVLATVFLLCGDAIFRLFSDQAEVLEYGRTIMQLMCVIVFMQISQVIYSGCLRGGGDVRFVAMVTLVAVGCVRPLTVWLLVDLIPLGVLGAWLGQLMDQLVRLVLSFCRFKHNKWLKLRV